MNLEKAIAQKNKIFPMPEGGYLHMIAEERARYMWLMRRIYDEGYELIFKEE